ncbi:MoxR-like ATPase [Sphingomonas sp. SORGH_AS802]|uniref:AAA family ATPase n=1 Tax=unclassified Sphingomonas TaxID=196159 RepID=UPI0028569947|nr:MULTISPECIES: MoxR family ATPase [unclassified Sphingomonas]MDR6125682.1 MoxR-like ATPase [Sphingomonas sp. SORGH_AS_0438]MDR6134291.1 MoxR-like ATPase [Sphingomonas sp. SORGH_AS_0802]
MQMIDQAQVAREQAAEFRTVFRAIRDQVRRMMVGQQDVIDGVLTALMAGGHVLLEGVPGLGKTMLINSISRAVDLPFSRIQFTPDMMPADIIGTTMLTEAEGGGHELTFQQGPIVANLVLADEINRATPKTQSALLEVMQERQVTVGRRTLKMPEPFCVMATQNPVDQEGTYPLPEAQLDRFLFKLLVGYPTEAEYHAIIDRTTGGEAVAIDPVTDAATLCRLREVVRQVPVPEVAKGYAIRLVMATQPGSAYAPESVQRGVALGASPRGVQGLILAAKVQCLLDDRFAVSCDDIAAIARPVLRHRVIVNYQAMARGDGIETLIDDILKAVQPA